MNACSELSSPLAAIAGLVVCLSSLSCRPASKHPSECFKEYVADPIPPSVTDIRVDQPKTLLGFGYIFRFKIGKADVDGIVGTRHLKRVASAKCENGFVKWGSNERSVEMMDPYGEGWRVRVPGWFREVEQWENPTGYVLDFLKQEPGMNAVRVHEVLIYDAELGEAFFLNFNVRQ